MEGSFPKNKWLCLLMQGIEIFLERLSVEIGKVPACLPFTEMKISQPAVVEGAVETKLLSPEV